MDTLICKGDHKADSRGIPIILDGIEEIIQQIIIRLSVPKGRFSLDKNLGSLLYTLPRVQSKQNSQRAYQYIEAALVDIPCAAVKAVDCRYNALNDRLDIAISIEINENTVDLEVSV